MEYKSNRREFIKKSVVAGSALSTAGCAGNMGIGKSLAEKSFETSKPIPKGLEYILKLRSMTDSVMSDDARKIERASLICAGALLNGGKVYYDDTGHGESQCILETIGGNPSFLKPLFGNESHKVITEKDVLISNRTAPCNDAHTKGAKTVGIIMAFEPKKFQGQGIVNRDFKGPYMEDICDVWIWDRTPFTIGILDFDLMPWKAIAAHGAMDGIILKLIAARTVDILLEKGYKVETT